MALCPAKVAIIGHSFVRRLQSYVNQDDSKRNLGLTYTSHQVAMRGGGGRRISHLQQEFAFIGRMQPEVVLIDIGTNDLDSLRKPVQVLARELFQVAATLRDRYNVKLVVICEVFYRTPVLPTQILMSWCTNSTRRAKRMRLLHPMFSGTYIFGTTRAWYTTGNST